MILIDINNASYFMFFCRDSFTFFLTTKALSTQILLFTNGGALHHLLSFVHSPLIEVVFLIKLRFYYLQYFPSRRNLIKTCPYHSGATETIVLFERGREFCTDGAEEGQAGI